MRTIVIGDIHGCLEEFDQLVSSVSYAKGKDRLLLLGDLIDRGPDPAGVVRRARELGADVVMGNHEEKALRWRKHELKRKAAPEHYKNPMTKIAESRLDQWRAVRDEDWEWLASCPTYTRIEAAKPWVAVHGGCMPFVEVEKQQPNELLRLRYVKAVRQPSGYLKYKMASLTEAGDKPSDDSDTNYYHWTELWDGPESVVYGHYTYDEIETTQLFKSPSNDIQCLGIDTGCVHGNKLTAAVFYTEALSCEFYQIPAKRVYAERKPWNESTE